MEKIIKKKNAERVLRMSLLVVLTVVLSAATFLLLYKPGVEKDPQFATDSGGENSEGENALYDRKKGFYTPLAGGLDAATREHIGNSVYFRTTQVYRISPLFFLISSLVGSLRSDPRHLKIEISIRDLVSNEARQLGVMALAPYYSLLGIGQIKLFFSTGQGNI